MITILQFYTFQLLKLSDCVHLFTKCKQISAKVFIEHPLYNFLGWEGEHGEKKYFWWLF